MSHDRKCTGRHGCQCDPIAEVEERLHPDDVRLKAQLIALGRDLIDAVERARRDDLLAKAEALVTYSTPQQYEWVDGAGWVNSDKVIDTLLRADVLALFSEEESDE